MNGRELDPPRIFETLLRHRVSFVVIGGMAAVLLGSPLLTSDVDICYARDKPNLERLASALRELAAEPRGVREKVPFILDARTLAMGDAFTFTTDAGPLDVLATPSGSTGYEALVSNAVEMEIAGMRVHVVSVDDLILMKRASGRAKDLMALPELAALREEIERMDGAQ